MKKFFALSIIALGSFAFGQTSEIQTTHDFEFEDGRNAHLVPTQEQKEKLQCTSAALFREVVLQGNYYSVTCSDYEYSYNYLRAVSATGGTGGGGGGHVFTPSPDNPGPGN